VPNPTFLGTVQDVNGVSVSIALDPDTISGLTFVDGQGYRIGQVGSFVRIPIGYTDLFGIVSQVGAGAVPERLATSQPFGHRWMTAQLFGEGTRRGEFKRGIAQYPAIGDPVHIVTESDLGRIYGREGAGRFVRVGSLANSDAVPALVDIDKLVTRHCAVVGATGSGKSTTVAGLLNTLSDPETYPAARIVVLDLHGEYASALGDRARIFRINPNVARGELPLEVPYWALTFDELLAVTVGGAEEKERAALIERVTQAKRETLIAFPRNGIDPQHVTADSPIPFSLHQLWLDLFIEIAATHTTQGTGQSRATIAWEVDANNQPVQQGDAMTVTRPRFQAQVPQRIFLSGSSLNIRRHLELLESKLRDPRLNFLFSAGQYGPNASGQVASDLDSLLTSWMGCDRPITILDLSGVPTSISTHVVGSLLRILYDSLFWGRNLPEGGRERPLLVVLEEAHTYLGSGGSNFAAQAVRRMVKEGRKYGIGAMIVSQRPSDIDPTILSQCGTMFAMRLSNGSDRAQVVSSVTDNLEGLMSMLPILRTGEAIIVGEGVQLPMRAQITAPPPGRRPDSQDPLVFQGSGRPGGWNQNVVDERMSRVIEVWRRQDASIPPENNIMERQAVSSSNVASVGYDPNSLTLEVEFHDGNVYQYFDVPQLLADGLIGAASVGSFLNQNIKGSFRYIKL
jgi:uncharacterized protein